MPQREPSHQSARLRIEDRRTLPREVGQHQQPLCPQRYFYRLRLERVEIGPTHQVAQPVRQAAGCGRTAGQQVGLRLNTSGSPQCRVNVIVIPSGSRT